MSEVLPDISRCRRSYRTFLDVGGFTGHFSMSEVLPDISRCRRSYRTVFDVVEDVKERHLALGAPLVLVDVGHHLLDLGEGLLQFLVVWVALRRVLQDVCEWRAKTEHQQSDQLNYVFQFSLAHQLNYVFSNNVFIVHCEDREL